MKGVLAYFVLACLLLVLCYLVDVRPRNALYCDTQAELDDLEFVTDLQICAIVPNCRFTTPEVAEHREALERLEQCAAKKTEEI